AMLIYQALVGVHINGWVRQKSEAIHTLHELPLVINNIFDFYGFVANSFNGHWWMYFAPILALMALIPVVIGIGYTMGARRAQPAWISVLMLVTSLLLPVAAL